MVLSLNTYVYPTIKMYYVLGYITVNRTGEVITLTGNDSSIRASKQPIKNPAVFFF
ncbi:hypothetical protein [Paenibacillus gallinarum]|uniref:Uncharacterized protein n=1 Tax=Paenibacillus gallinarum TaxID=2762232 RepID=A0ABR8T5N8_9BACL|nr:hypothetical protein [Paenibacillus gallinarum]MBD7971042.1 hypothetical protein [Paenibacillus gallinarum]